MGDILIKASLQKRPSVFMKLVDNFKKSQYYKNSKNLGAHHHHIIGDPTDYFQEQKKATKQNDYNPWKRILKYLAKNLQMRKFYSKYIGKLTHFQENEHFYSFKQKILNKNKKK